MDAHQMEDKGLPPREARILAKLRALAASAPELSQEMLADLMPAPRSEAIRTEAIRTERRRLKWRHHSTNRHAAKLKRTPPWADLGAIRTLHAEAQRLTRESGVEHHVDHVIPLRGRLVSGLHVHTNMQILTGSDNSKKWNKFVPEEFGKIMHTSLMETTRDDALQCVLSR